MKTKNQSNLNPRKDEVDKGHLEFFQTMVAQKFGRQQSKSPKDYVKINQNLDRIPVPRRGM